MLKKSVPRYLLLGICCFLLWQIPSVHILGENKIVDASSTEAYQLDSFEAQIVRRINEERAKKKSPPLSINERLNATADQKSRDMLERNYFSHKNPEGDFIWKQMKKNGYAYRYAGENLARNFSEADSVVSAWMQSESHRKNILGNNFDEIGIGVEKDGQGRFYITSLFGKKRPGFFTD